MRTVKHTNYFAPLLFVLTGILSGCGTKELPGIAEYRQITTQALTSVKQVLKSLDKVSAKAPSSPKVISNYRRDLQQLEVLSIQVRARSQAILARGDAYFADWSNSIARIENPKVRELAARSRPELEQSFSKIKLSSQQAGAAFRPFLAGLRELRVKLETDPNSVGTAPARDLIQKTRQNGQQVVRELEAIESELTTMTMSLTPK